MSDIGPVFMQFEPGIRAPEGFIPLCVPEIRGNEWRYIKECLDTNWVSSAGPFIDRFERMVADYVGVKYAVATVNGTAALHIALLVAGIQRDDEVLVSTLTFIAPSNAIRYVGAWPVFTDAELNHWQMDPRKVMDFLEKACRWQDGALYNAATGRRIKAILPVHILGHPVNMEPLLGVARKYNLVVIEDAAEGLGAKYLSTDGGERVGSLGDIGCISFNGNKIITAGGGGMIVTNNGAWASRAKYLTTQAKDDSVEYIHHEIGYNYRLTQIQAAIAVAQLEQLDDYINAKRRIAVGYAEALKDVPGITPMREAPWAFSTFWMYTVLVNEARFGMDRRTLFHKLRAVGIETRPLWQPLHLSSAHAKARAGDCLVAEQLYREALSLPCSVGLRPETQHKVVTTLGWLARDSL